MDKCIYCKGIRLVKNGRVNGGHQRWKCKDCGVSSTGMARQHYPLATMLDAFKLYCEGFGFRAIGRFLKLSNVTVMRWVRDAGALIASRVAEDASLQPNKPELLEVDELWHYIKKNSARDGYLLLCAVPRDGSSPLQWVIVANKTS